MPEPEGAGVSLADALVHKAGCANPDGVSAFVREITTMPPDIHPDDARIWRFHLPDGSVLVSRKGAPAVMDMRADPFHLHSYSAAQVQTAWLAARTRGHHGAT